jgi:hypothetical protein
MAQNNLTSPNAHVHPIFKLLLDNLTHHEIERVERIMAAPQVAHYQMLDLAGNVLEVRRMTPAEARDTNLELEAEDSPYEFVPLSQMFD